MATNGPDAAIPPPRTLGDIPSLTELSSVGVEDYTLGTDFEGDPLGLGGEYTDFSDPFSIAMARQRTEMLEAAQPERAGEGARDPQSRSHLPSVDQLSDPGATVVYDDNGVIVPSDASSTVTGSVPGFDSEQMQNAAVIAEVGRELGASNRDIQIAFMTAIVESGLRNLDYGDRDSIGMFQQRDAWGSREDRLDPHESARMFFLGGEAGQQGLLDIPKAERDRRPMGDLAQDVQVSAFPERYAQHEAEAAQILSNLRTKIVRGGYEGKDPYGMVDDGHGHTLDYITAAALERANENFGGALPVTQGSHNAGGVAASGGTHDGGGVVDIIVEDGRWEEAVVALRKVGFAAWDRTPDQGPWPRHIHAVLVGHEQLSPQAAQQVQSYLNNDNGLVGSALDDGPRDWVGTIFKWDDVVKDPVEHHRRKVVSRASQFVGTPFKWGGEDYTGTDAVGLVRNIYGNLGVDLPKDPGEIAFGEDPIPLDEAAIGDLVAWDPRTGAPRMGVYLGDGLVVSADGPGTDVRLNVLGDITDAWGIPLSSLLNRRQKDKIVDRAVEERNTPRLPEPTIFTPSSSSNSVADSTPRGLGHVTPTTPTPSRSPSRGSSSSRDNAGDATPRGFGSW